MMATLGPANDNKVMVTRSGSFRLLRVAGIDVLVHWSWFIVAIFEINTRRSAYSSLAWNAAEYVALFAIVLLHEFGHALACRQVGGQANRIILWPLGGLAFVAPPQRPGATLWAIAAGPLVNLILIPIAFLLAVASARSGFGDALPDGQHFLQALVYINVGLLIFNLLPIYPLDGGQILRALLWFVFGRARSLMLATMIGFVGASGLVAWAIFRQSVWMGIMGSFMLLTCWKSWKHARLLSRLDQMPTHAEFACPICKAAPPIGAFWLCHGCGTQFDTFATGAVCPKCQTYFAATACFHCGASRPMTDWMQPTPITTK
jgi:Zn-dependent protease